MRFFSAVKGFFLKNNFGDGKTVRCLVEWCVSAVGNVISAVGNVIIAVGNVIRAVGIVIYSGRKCECVKTNERVVKCDCEGVKCR